MKSPIASILGTVTLSAVQLACEQRVLHAERPDVTLTARGRGAALAPDALVVPRASPLDVSVVEGRSCTRDEDCPSGRCFDAHLEAQYSRVLRDCPDARSWRAGRRLGTCVVDACARDTDCPPGQRCGTLQMVPFPQRVCLPAGCRAPGVCVAHGRVGQCYPYLAGRPCEHGGWACSFPDDECSPVEVARRCRPVDGRIAYCIPVHGRFRCVREEPLREGSWGLDASSAATAP